MSEWKTIESAPKHEGKWILIADADRVSVGAWDAPMPGAQMRWISVNGYFGSLTNPRYQPTHWMPLPEPPNPESDQ